MLDAADFFGRDRVTLFHGSPCVVKHPRQDGGNPNNDYGPGFYATELEELASEWACPSANDGWTNEYLLDAHGLRVLDLSSGAFTVLNWMAVLLANRKVSLSPGVAQSARDYLLKNHTVDLSDADLVYGYRADDSYFQLARAFLSNRIPVEVLEQSLFLGGLGYQVAIVSQQAFAQLSWVEARPASGSIWHPRRAERDAEARAAALRLQEEAISAHNGTFIVDIMRGAFHE